VHQPVPAGEPAVASGAVLTGQQPTPERRPKRRTEAQGLGHREVLPVPAAFDEAVLQLNAGNRNEPSQFGQTDFRPALLKLAGAKPDDVTARSFQRARDVKPRRITGREKPTEIIEGAFPAYVGRQERTAFQLMRKCVADGAAAATTSRTRTDMLAAFRRSAQYEWLFWDGAWRQRGWPASG